MTEENKKESFWKSNWHWIVFFLFWLTVFPYILNKLILSKSCWDVVGGPVEWLAFWPSYLSALASAAMIAYTAKTLNNNKKQLDELKRQWDIDHMPNVSVSFNFVQPYAYLRFENISNVEVKDFCIRLEFYEDDCLKNDFVPADRKSVIDNLKVNIEPRGIRSLVIRNDLRGLTNKEVILVYMTYNGSEREPVKIVCNDMFTIGDFISNQH